MLPEEIERQQQKPTASHLSCNSRDTKENRKKQGYQNRIAQISELF
jgi:hypothetical protein